MHSNVLHLKVLTVHAMTVRDMLLCILLLWIKPTPLHHVITLQSILQCTSGY